MNEPLPGPADAPTPEPAARSAGALLKAAREREGLHLAVLAATIKVSPAKLEALERDRYDQLPNATFTRALAQSVCRSLKIDPRPVLSLLPQVDNVPLEGAMGKLNTPFQERPSRTIDGHGHGLAWASKPMFLAGGLLLLAAVAVALLPPDFVDSLKTRAGAVGTDAPAAPASSVAVVALTVPPTPASSPAVVASPQPAPVPAAASAPLAVPAAALPASAVPVPRADLPPAVAPASSAAAPVPAPAPKGLLQMEASAATWIEVLGAQGQPLFSRVLQPGEAVGVDGPAPLRLRIGNVQGTALTFRGQAVDLAPYTRDNVARLELR